MEKRKIMAPNASDVNGVLFESDAATPDMALPTPPRQQADSRSKQLVWRNIILFAYLHLAALYGGYLFLFSAKWQTDVFGKLLLLSTYFTVILVTNVIDKNSTQTVLFGFAHYSGNCIFPVIIILLNQYKQIKILGSYVGKVVTM